LTSESELILTASFQDSRKRYLLIAFSMAIFIFFWTIIIFALIGNIIYFELHWSSFLVIFIVLVFGGILCPITAAYFVSRLKLGIFCIRDNEISFYDRNEFSFSSYVFHPIEIIDSFTVKRDLYTYFNKYKFNTIEFKLKDGSKVDAGPLLKKEINEIKRFLKMKKIKMESK